jgi:hypothetical protein
MIHHERLRPPAADYPAEEWAVIEKRYHPEFVAQLETMMALGNGYRECGAAQRKAHQWRKTALC